MTGMFGIEGVMRYPPLVLGLALPSSLRTSLFGVKGQELISAEAGDVV
jgi:hypothetical protein